MKKLIGLLVVVFIANANQIFAQEKVYKIGDPGPAGGLIFYVDPADAKMLPVGITYLEAAPGDQDPSEGIQWHNGSYMSTVAIGKAIGKGKTNTAVIVEKQGAGKYAAKLCDDLVIGGYSDWFLPSKDELNRIYTSLAYNYVGGFPDHRSYWSSSEASSNMAWYQEFNVISSWNQYEDYGHQGINFKEGLLAVRCARAF